MSLFPEYISEGPSTTGGERVEDKDIVALYLRRDADAVAETLSKYGAYCRTVARRLLGDESDVEECVSDAMLAAWNSIPPHEPERLQTYLAKLTRRIAVNRLEERMAQKRGGGEAVSSMEELGACIPGGERPEDTAEAKRLSACISAYLRSLTEEKRRIFVCRYWYAMGVKEIALRFGFSGTKTANILSRARKGLKEYLMKEGFFDESI